MSLETWTLLIAVVTAVTCGLCGSLLVVNRQAMVSEGLSHAVLPGLVIAFIFFRSFDSPWLIVSAAAGGLLMVWITQSLAQTRLIDSDAGLGMVFAGMFSLGILLVSLNLKNAHFHADCIIDGNLALAPLDRVDLPLFGRVPKSLITMSITLTLIALFVTIAYKELKVMIFDATHATQVGLRPGLVSYCWLGLVSLTTVTAFEVAGSVLIVALMIAPPASAFLITRRYGRFLFLSMGIAAFCAVVGYYVALAMDISPTGPIASVAGMVFILVFLLNPSSGLLASVILARRKRNRILQCLAAELIVDGVMEQDAVGCLRQWLNLSETDASRLLQELLDKQWVVRSSTSDRFTFGDAGRRALDQLETAS